jgi:hypothetical protein
MNDKPESFSRATIPLGESPSGAGESPALPIRNDPELLSKLRPRVREKVLALLEAFDVIDAAAPKLKMETCRALAEKLGHQRGLTAHVLYGKYWLLKRGNSQFPAGDWRLLVDRTQAGKLWQQDRVRVPVATIEYFQSLCARKQRGKALEAHVELVDQWRRWRAGDESAAIPGYLSCPPADPKTDLPKGWTFSNLVRLRPTHYQQKLINIGPKAAAEFRPQIPRTRAGLEVGQYYLFDDKWLDFKVNTPGAREGSRLLSFFVLDLFSACNFARGFKPALENEITGIQERLKEQEMLWLTTHVLCTEGYRRAGTTLICEGGTARIREREAEIFARYSGGAIVVQVGATSKAPAFAGFFDSAARGNFRFKAQLESFFNLLGNRTDDQVLFRGQVGSNARLNCPEELAGRERHNNDLIVAFQGLPADVARRLVLDFLPLAEAIDLVNSVCHRINGRTEHDLEGWRGAGLITQEWRPSPHVDFLPASALEALPMEDQRRIADYIGLVPNLTRERKLSPFEVWQGGRRDFVRLPLAAAAEVLGALDGHERPVRNSLLAWAEPLIDPDEEVVYEAIVRDGNGSERLLRDGEKFLVRVNPLMADRAFVYDARNGFLGVCRRYGRTRPDDVAGLERAFGRQAHIEALALKEAKRIGAPIVRAELARRRQNATLLGGEHPSPAPALTSSATLDDLPEAVSSHSEEVSLAEDQLRALEEL